MGKVMFMKKGEVHTVPKGPGIAASELAVGSSVYLNENGTPGEYLVVNQGIPSNSSRYDSSCDGIWLLRKDVYALSAWDTHENSIAGIHLCCNDYANSNIHSYLNGTILPLFDSETQSAIVQATIPYWQGNTHSGELAKGANGLSAKIFLLSGIEVGLTTSVHEDRPADGAKLSYFTNGVTSAAKALRVANYNGSAKSWWLRSPLPGWYTTDSDDINVYDLAFFVLSSGDFSNVTATRSSYGVRPALILPSNTQFDPDTLLFKGV